MPDTIPSHPHTAGRATRTGRVERDWFQQLQALEDAIAYRRARAAAPCPDCTASGHRCDDHACDLDLIADYQRTAIAILDGSSQTLTSRPADTLHDAPRDEIQRAQPSLP